MAETRHPNGSDLDNRRRFGAHARHAGDSPTAVRSAGIRALARSLRSKLQARVYQAWIFYRKASAKGSSEIAARSPGMVVVGAVVAPTRARAFPVIYPATQIGNGSCLPIGIGPGKTGKTHFHPLAPIPWRRRRPGMGNTRDGRRFDAGGCFQDEVRAREFRVECCRKTRGGERFWSHRCQDLPVCETLGLANKRSACASEVAQFAPGSGGPAAR